MPKSSAASYNTLAVLAHTYERDLQSEGQLLWMVGLDSHEQLQPLQSGNGPRPKSCFLKTRHQSAAFQGALGAPLILQSVSELLKVRRCNPYLDLKT